MSHKERNNVRAAYIHKAELIEERRLIMNWWSRYQIGDNVTRIKAKPGIGAERRN
ncbi:hypothetical protein SAMN03159473_05582 [Pseudomonas sp. NFACC52]|nr:hypothetical protein SAMN03159481_05727 [Pseudomonas sp. NFACC56-3]SFL06953.1 hypothetical protein SAMN03159473_05582 [Pseudomonas sp. NFACC52]